MKLRRELQKQDLEIRKTMIEANITKQRKNDIQINNELDDIPENIEILDDIKKQDNVEENIEKKPVLLKEQDRIDNINFNI
jgi:hypothetical protein